MPGGGTGTSVSPYLNRIRTNYCTLAELKLELGISDSTDDAKLTLALGAASRWIDGKCGWRFYTTLADEVRYYTAENGGWLDIPDGLLSLTTLAHDYGDRSWGEVWAATDYDLTPRNAPLSGWPYTRIAISPFSRYGFARYSDGVKLVGKFGYSATAPDDIKRACILKAQQLFMRKDMPFGIMSASAVGTVTMRVPEDADILGLIAPYKRSIT